MSKDGVETDPKKIQVILDWLVPQTVYDVRSFLGFTNYYRKFMFRYSQIAKPLNGLISGENAKKKKAPVDWQSCHQEAFNQLKRLCSEAPILAYADYTKPFRVYTDASEIGLGAVISQKQGDKEHVIAYTSQSLNKAECRYDHEYLYGREFDVFMDNNLLTYILTTAKLDATGQRWVAALSIYNFQIYYRSGKTNANADALSRIPWDASEVLDSQKMDKVTVQATMTKAETPCVPQGEQSIILLAAQFFAPDYAPKMSIGEWRQEQEKDIAICKIVQLMRDDLLFKYRSTRDENPKVQNYLKIRKSLCVVETLLHRKVQLKNHLVEVNQFVLPTPYRRHIILACHNEMGHLGMDRTLLLLQDRVYWPGMSKDVREHIRTCDRCERFKDRPDREEIDQTEAQYPLEMVHIDFLMIGGKKDP